jgi:hypothetical protein
MKWSGEAKITGIAADGTPIEINGNAIISWGSEDENPTVLRVRQFDELTDCGYKLDLITGRYTRDS